jgi:hypothetical protein
VLEVDTWVWLGELGRTVGRRVTLGSVPDTAWDAVLPPGTDAVWLMGVWQRSSYAARRAHEVWADQARELLPDLVDADVPGSPYAVRSYTVDDHLGGDAGLAVAREQLAARGVRLVLDHVPNHIAVEHPWVTQHPDVAVPGSLADLAREPEAFLRLGDRVLACGRDPNLPAWSDVVQLDPFSPTLRRLTVDTLRSIADRCDGVRVDMAMLLLDDVAQRTWGERIGSPRSQPFWVQVLRAVRHTHPDLHVIGEVYWDRQPELIAQGFDRCYDKALTDELLAADGPAVHARLDAEVADQHRTLRFLENHDERRAVTAFGRDRVRAAAAVVALAPGGLLLFEGQLDGRQAHLPVGLGRRPPEPVDTELRAWYEQLLAVRGRRDRQRSRFTLHRVRDVSSPTGRADRRSEHVLAWTWEDADERLTVVVELGARAGEVVVELGPHDAGPRDGAGPRPAGDPRGGAGPRHGGDRRGGTASGGRVVRPATPVDALDGRELPTAHLAGDRLTLRLAPHEVVVVTT